MHVNTHPRERWTLEDFAEEHGLAMEVHERGHGFEGTAGQWYAKFGHDACTADGGILTSEHGNGRTPEVAITNYARRIQGKLLVLRPMCADERRIWVPQLSA